MQDPRFDVVESQTGVPAIRTSVCVTLHERNHTAGKKATKSSADHRKETESGGQNVRRSELGVKLHGARP